MAVSRILVVDDDRFSRNFCSQMLKEEEGYEVLEAANVEDAIKIIRQGGINLVVSDLVMPGKSGLDLVEILRLESPGLRVILVTGHGTIESAVKAMKLGALDYIRKPLNPAEFKIVVRRAMEQVRLAEENQELKNSLKLYDVSSRISRTIEIEELYRVIFELILQETGATRGLLYLVDQENGSSTIAVSEGFDPDENEGLDRAVYLAFAQPLTNRTTPFVPAAIPKDLVVNYRSSTDPIQSLMFVPLRNKGELVGMVVFFDTEKKDAFGEREEKVAAFLGEHSGSAIENALLYSQAKILTITDDLTNVFNYRYLNNILDRELVRAQRLNSAMSILFMDLDSFKKVNDSHGHLIGSKILVELAGILKSAVRKVDAVARYGGDEYIIVLTDTPSAGAMVVAERIRQMVEDHVFLEKEYAIRLTASLGVASYPEHGLNKVELLHLADEAMYRGKFGRKNIVYLATPGQRNGQPSITPMRNSDKT